MTFEKLTHAYGKAGDLPAKLAALSSPSAKDRADAIFMIGASICHQGTFYSATPKAIPLLLEILAAPKTQDRERILKLCADILTLDDHARFVLDGLVARKLPKLPKLYERSLEAARAGFDLYVSLLAAPEAEVRSVAAFTLAWIDERASESLPRVRRALESESDADVRASLVLCLGMLARHAASDAEAPLFESMRAAKPAAVRAAATIALAHVSDGARADGEMLASAASDPGLAATSLPWLDGDLALYAARVLAALPASEENDARLLRVVGAATTAAPFAANVLAHRLFARRRGGKTAAGRSAPKRGARRDLADDAILATLTTKLAELAPPQRAFFDTIAGNPRAFDDGLAELLLERGLPSTPELVTRFLGKSTGPTVSILDRRMDAETIGEAIARAAKAPATKRAEVVAALVATLPADDVIDAALAALVELTVEDIHSVALDLAWAAGPRAERALAAARERFERDGAPTRTQPDGAKVTFPGAFVVVAVGFAARAIAMGEPAAPFVDRWLQEAYGYLPRVRDALAALPIARREAWVLDPKRDDRAQPAESFQGAWPYWTATPTQKIAARALAHVATWKPRDPWGGKRSQYAEPHLAALIAALRAAGEDATACEESLARMKRGR